MIIDEPLPKPSPAGNMPAVSLSLPTRITMSPGNQTEVNRLLNIGQSLTDRIDQADALIESVQQSLMSQFDPIIDSADASYAQLIGTFRGHASRLADKSLSLLNSVTSKSAANVNRQIASADELLWSTVARPVANRDETASVLATTPILAAIAPAIFAPATCALETMSSGRVSVASASRPFVSN